MLRTLAIRVIEMLVSCKICEHPRGTWISQQVSTGAMSIEDGSRELGVSSDALWYHITNHFEIEVSEKTQSDVELLRDCLNMIHNRIEDLKNTPVNPINEKMIASLVHELRGLAIDLAQLEGRLQQLPVIRLTMVTSNFNKIVSFMMTELPPDQQAKLVKFMENEISVAPTSLSGTQSFQRSG